MQFPYGEKFGTHDKRYNLNTDTVGNPPVVVYISEKVKSILCNYDFQGEK